MSAIDDLWEDYQQSQSRRTSVRVGFATLQMTDEGHLDAAGKRYLLADSALAAFANLLGIPAPYFCSRPHDLQAWLFNRELGDALKAKRLPTDVGLVVEDGQRVAGLCKPHLPVLPAAMVFTGVMARAPRSPRGSGNRLMVRKDWMPNHTATALLAPKARVECQQGDDVVAGVEISMGPDGHAGAQVNTLLFRKVCGNGFLVPPRDEAGRRLRIRTPPSDSRPARYAFCKQVRRVARAAWKDIEPLLGALKQLVCVPVGNLAEAADSVARLAHLTLCSKVRCQILQALERDAFGPGDTMYHVLNACSWVGTHDEERPVAWRRRLLFACGEVLRRQLEGHPLAASARPGPDERPRLA
ncbi:MAG: hypothetical protein FJ290_25730 [Planctomycetes bacterium]|nr:hypothetical protein [Planctomycetota bacterium]